MLKIGYNAVENYVYSAKSLIGWICSSPKSHVLTDIQCSTFEDKVMHYVRDIIDPSGSDPQYVFARAKDWYTGHSWANGLISAFADSKNQVKNFTISQGRIAKETSNFSGVNLRRCQCMVCCLSLWTCYE